MNKATMARQAKNADSSPPVKDTLCRRFSCETQNISRVAYENRAVTNGRLRLKLAIGSSNDPLEREADRVAGQVLATPVHSVQSSAPQLIQRYSGQTPQGPESVPTSVDRTLNSPGRPLEQALQNDMEQRFSHDFSQVRVHTESTAEQSARDLDAHAYTAGKDIVFGQGRYAPDTFEGRRLLAHELVHVVQQSNGATGQKPIIQRRRCASGDAADDIVDTHIVSPATGISSPGDAVDFAVRFNCEVRGFRSDLEDSGGTSLNMAQYPPASSFPRATFKRTWDGKRSFSNVGTYMVDDGRYRHRLSEVLYAYRFNPTSGVSDNLYASGAGLVSPYVQVSTRAGAFSNRTSNHFSTANVETVARIIRSEMGIGNEIEQRAIAWAVRNQMVRLNTNDATIARDHFRDAHDQSSTDDSRLLAQEVLAIDMGNDTIGGAIKWFSPRSMPSEGESCAGFDCGGGLITVADLSGVNHRKYAPTFHNDMNFIPLAGAREWLVRFYGLN